MINDFFKLRSNAKLIVFSKLKFFFIKKARKNHSDKLKRHVRNPFF